MQQTIEHFNKMKKRLWIRKGDNSARIDKCVWALQKLSYMEFHAPSHIVQLYNSLFVSNAYRKKLKGIITPF